MRTTLSTRLVIGQALQRQPSTSRFYHDLFPDCRHPRCARAHDEQEGHNQQPGHIAQPSVRTGSAGEEGGEVAVTMLVMGRVSVVWL